MNAWLEINHFSIISTKKLWFCWKPIMHHQAERTSNRRYISLVSRALDTLNTDGKWHYTCNACQHLNYWRNILTPIEWTKHSFTFFQITYNRNLIACPCRCDKGWLLIIIVFSFKLSLLSDKCINWYMKKNLNINHIWEYFICLKHEYMSISCEIPLRWMPHYLADY